ncbi:MAG: hypothetical protein HP497_06090 [Nitrospira sp.]|nr:hypothetical protein [Nitrospira sp.]
MPVTVTRYSELTQAFRLGTDDIKKLSDILSLLGDKFTCRNYYTDGFAREYPTDEELLEYENPPTKAMRALQIQSRSATHQGYASLDFRHTTRDSITIHPDGPEDIISKVNSNLNDFFPRINRWYGFIAVRDYTNVMFNLLFVLLAAIVIGIAVGFIPAKEAEPQKESAVEKVRGYLLAGSIPISLFFIGFSTNRIRDWLFPVAEFAIGQGFNRDAHPERLRAGVVGLIFVPSLLSALAYMISRIAG